MAGLRHCRGAIGTGGLLAPFLLAVAGIRLFNARNCIGALIALLLLLAGSLSERIGRRYQLGCVALITAAGLGVSIALHLDANLERPDFRDAALELNAGLSGQRALVVSPGGDTVLLLYRAAHRPVIWPTSGASVSEIDVVEADGRPPAQTPPAGFRMIGTRRFGTVSLIRFIATSPRPVSSSSLLALTPGRPRRILILERRG